MISMEEAARIARAYGMSFTDAIALRDTAADVPEAKHLAIQFGGTDTERADEAYTISREQRDAEQATENEAFAAYREAHPKPPKPTRKPVEPDLRDGMTDRERMQATQAAHEANVKADAAELSDATQQRAGDYFDWKAAGKPV